MAKEIQKALNPGDARAQDLIVEAAKQIIELETNMDSIKEDIKAIKDEMKAEGINVSALNTAIRRFKAVQSGKQDIETNLTESDIYLEVIQSNLA